MNTTAERVVATALVLGVTVSYVTVYWCIARFLKSCSREIQ